MPRKHSTVAPAALEVEHPEKPSDDFPLFWHKGNRCWAKKVKYKFRYFSSDWQTALVEYKKLQEDLENGVEPSSKRSTCITVGRLCDHFYDAKERQVKAGERKSQKHLGQLYDSCEMLSKSLGKHTPVDELTPERFRRLREKASKGVRKAWSPIKLNNEIRRWKSVFNWGYKEGLIERIPNFGTAFDPVPVRRVRESKLRRGSQMLERDELMALLGESDVQMRAMLLLAINGGLGPADLAHVEIKQVDFENGWLDQWREKTAINRRIPLWPETVDAIKVAMVHRAKPEKKAHAKLLFIQRNGNPFTDDEGNAASISKRFEKVAERLQARRAGVGIYGARRAFQTVADESRDAPAVKAIMGHVDDTNDMSAVYRQRISDDRLRAVVNHVRTWLFGEAVK